jgi:hypothetical protein
MKTVLFIMTLFFSMTFAFAQKAPPKKKAVVGKRANINMYHNRHDLEKLRKTSLKSLYIRRVLSIYEVLPFLPLNGVQGATVADLGIPETKDNIKMLEKDLKAKVKYTKKMEKHLYEYLGYAEKEYLIDGIMFMEDLMGHLDRMHVEVEQRIKD